MIKVASYCRVSTDSADQANSFESQQRYFREYIERHPDWELYRVYADEGITGTSTKKRVQFNKMIQDAYRGQFKMIITKEVSRFSRNLLDTIAYTRALKSLGIGVIFMNDGFTTLDPDAELRLSIMGSIAQEESRKTSSRVKWGQTRQMEQGVVFGTSMLGYDIHDGKITVNPEGARLVKLIFHKYVVEKKGTSTIARELREAGVKTYNGHLMWSDAAIVRLLRNEKYTGDLVQKKSVTPDFLTHKRKKNEGEEELITIKDHHEPIIGRELWNEAQEKLTHHNRRRTGSAGHSTRYIFSGKIVCAECGARFVSRTKTRKSGSTYMRWGCYTACSQGYKKIDAQGNSIGCNVGKQIRDDLGMEILTKVLQSIPVDFGWITQNLTQIVLSAIQTEEAFKESPDRLKTKIRQLQKKREASIDAYVSGIITDQELRQMKERYREKEDALQQKLEEWEHAEKVTPSQLHAELQTKIQAIVSCENVSEPYYKALLQTMTVHKDGTIEIKINALPQKWIYRLVYHKAGQEKE